MQHAHRVHGRARAALEKVHGVTRTAVRTAEVGASAFGFGVLQGRLPADKQKVMGVDVALGSSVLLHVMGFAGIGGDYSGHLHSFGDGALAAFLVKEGILVGAKMQAKNASKVQGELSEGVEGQSLSDEELSALQNTK
jgi:hypothetical protein